MQLEIKKDKDPILRQPTVEVSDFGVDFQHLIDNMLETMRGKKGIGLAAPQISESKKVFICEFAGDKEAKLDPIPLTVICNPEIVKYSKNKVRMVEGCLSFPGMEILVKRPKKIKITGQDRYGKPLEIEADKLYSRVIQHENDHLNAVLLPDHIEEIKVIFIGTGSLGLPTLEALALDPQYKIELVVTSVVNAKSRNRKKVFNPIEKMAGKYNLPILKVANIRDQEIIKKIATTKPDIGVMADFGQIIPQDVLDIPKHGIVNIHPSLLPKHRGPSPVQNTILSGDKETGVSLILTTAKMDAGPIISQATTELTGSENTIILKDFLAKGAATLVLNSLPYYIAGDLKPEPQDENSASYSKMIKKEDGLVDLKTDPIQVERKIRALIEWPKTYLMVRGKRVQLLESHFDQANNLVIDRVKPEGKKEMTYDEYLRGHKVALTFKQ